MMLWPKPRHYDGPVWADPVVWLLVLLWVVLVLGWGVFAAEVIAHA